MHSSIEGHIGAAILERYSLRELATEELEAVERHLSRCSACRGGLTGIEPLNTVRQTQDGPFYSRITRLRDGSYVARHWGCQIHGGWRHGDLAAACKYLADSVAEMFPEHCCTEECTDAPPSAEHPS
jgi:hypothetical protein